MKGLELQWLTNSTNEIRDDMMKEIKRWHICESESVNVRGISTHEESFN